MNFEKILTFGGYIIAVCALIYSSLLIRSFLRFGALLRVAHVDFLSLAKCRSSSTSESHARLTQLVTEALADQATLLCHRGEQLARYILDEAEYGDDLDARVMRRKLAFMKKRSDLFVKYRRLPNITYGWILEDDESSWPEKAKQFEKDWDEIDRAFDTLNSIY